MKSRARHWKASLREMRSLRTLLMTRRRNSSFCSGGGVHGLRKGWAGVQRGKKHWLMTRRRDSSLCLVGGSVAGVEVGWTLQSVLDATGGAQPSNLLMILRCQPLLRQQAHLIQEHGAGHVAHLLLSIPAASRRGTQRDAAAARPTPF